MQKRTLQKPHPAYDNVAMFSARTSLILCACLLAIGANAQSLKSYTLGATSTKGGSQVTGTVTLDKVAPAAGSIVTLTSGNIAAQVPASVKITGGQTTGTFNVTTSRVAADTTVLLSAKLGTVTKTASLKVLAPVLTALTASPTAVLSGSQITATATLDSPAPDAGTTLKLSSSSSAASVAATVKVNGGQTSTVFVIHVSPTCGKTTVTIKASLGSVTKSVALTTTPVQVSLVGKATRYQRAEFKIDNVPASDTPFDSDKIALDAVIISPTGKMKIVPCYYTQDYTRALTNSNEVLTASGLKGWRLRMYPDEAGSYSVTVTINKNGNILSGAGATTVAVASGTKPAGPGGYVTGNSGQFFLTSTGETVPLIGHDVCWFDGQHGTYDYDTWFAAMTKAGENFTRIWMCPWAFGLEVEPGSLNNYRLDHAWDLDQVLDNADKSGIFVQLCLDYHGMFETQPDYWGGNNYWTTNPYNMAKGGPCANQQEFFTSSVAKNTYKKRLRYMIARYGYNAHLLAWEFFNEIDNVYQYLNHSQVVAWHDEMSKWLSSQDPYKHLITTSYVNYDRPDIWNLSKIGIVEMHPYAVASPGTAIPNAISGLRAKYSKPVLVAEFGTDWRGWNRTTTDPFLRGFRQGIWSAAMGQATGTAMSWWWEDLNSENDYTYYKSMRSLLTGTAWGTGPATPVAIQGSDELAGLGDKIAGGSPFTVTVPLDSNWGTMVSGELALANSAQADRGKSNLNSFVQGSYHTDLKRPFKIGAWFSTGAKLTLHLNSVADAAVLSVLVDGTEVLHQALPNKDGKYDVNHEYDTDIDVPISAGKHIVEVQNAGGDWFYLDWVKVTNALPANLSVSPIAVGQSYAKETLLYCYNPSIDFPANALNDVPEVAGSILNVPVAAVGTYKVTWSSPVTGLLVLAATVTTTTKTLSLPVPKYKEDLFVRIVKSQ